jgi:hypothetical protein
MKKTVLQRFFLNLPIFPSQEKTTELRNNYKERKKERKTGCSGVGRCLKMLLALGWFCRGSTSFPGLSCEEEVGVSGKFEK